MNLTDTYTLITGASGGIGKEFAIQLSAMGHKLILVGRKLASLEAVRAQLTGAQAAASLCLPCDLSVPGAAGRLHAECKARALDVGFLVNNAGIGLFGPAADMAESEVEAMVNLNVSSLSNLCSLFGADMQKLGTGSILNVGSFAGLNATPYFASYAATKSYVLAFSLALRAELKSSGVHVTCLLPGYVRTAFDGNAGIRNPAYLKFSESNSLSAAQVAAVGIRAAARNKAWTVAGARNKFAAALFSLLPRTVPPSIMKSFLDRLVHKPSSTGASE